MVARSELCIRLVFRRLRVRSSSPAKHSFMEIGHEVISTAILSADSSRAVVSYWRKDMHLILANCLGSLMAKPL